MKFWYMSWFRWDLIDEINFAKKHFNFVEITIQLELLHSIDSSFINALKDITHWFETLGHIHRDIVETNDIKKNIKILKEIWVKKVTFHPFEDLSIEENIKIFNKINNFLQKNKMILLIENVSNHPFNTPQNINRIVENVPNSKITLDVWHANKIYELDNFFNIFKEKIWHIHLHDNLNQLDHMFYESWEKLNQMIDKLKFIWYNNTITLETFAVLKDWKSISQDFEGLKKLHKQQLKKNKLQPDHKGRGIDLHSPQRQLS